MFIDNYSGCAGGVRSISFTRSCAQCGRISNIVRDWCASERITSAKTGSTSAQTVYVPADDLANPATHTFAHLQMH